MSRIKTRLLRLESQAARRPECPVCSPEPGNVVFTVRPPRVLGDAEPLEEEPPKPSRCSACGREVAPTVFTVRPPRAIAVGGDE